MFNGFALNNIQNAYVGSTPAQAIYLGSTLIWPTIPPHDYSRDYLTIVSLANNNDIIYTGIPTAGTDTISVSTDNGNTWTSYSVGIPGTTIATLNNGDKLLLKNNGQNNPIQAQFSSTGNFNVEGNIMSLMYDDNFIGQTTLTCKPIALFSGCTTLISAENLILPSTTLPNNAYYSMFSGCTSLTTPPELPATTLAQRCYQSMFENCTSLTTVPELSATTLADSCYFEMFLGCTSLTTTPELLATTLTDHCYYNMFLGCTSLNYIKCLATDISANACTLNWVYDVAATGTFVKDANTTWPSGTSGIPSGWTVINA